MFDLKKEVRQYCQSVCTNRFGRSAQILELEDHLHCEIERMVNRGIPPEEAFFRATTNLGGTTLLQHEFRKNMQQNSPASYEFARRISCWRDRIYLNRFRCRAAVAVMLVLVATLVFRLLPDTVSLQSASNLFENCCVVTVEFLNLSESSR